jgi:hypothetical protein
MGTGVGRGVGVGRAVAVGAMDAVGVAEALVAAVGDVVVTTPVASQATHRTRSTAAKAFIVLG